MSEIPDFTGSERWAVQQTLKERYAHDVAVEQAEAEIRLHRDERHLTTCPALFWQVDGCSFVIFKCGDRRYRCQFFYRLHQQYGTGVKEFDDLAECMVTLLQTQADHARQQSAAAQD